ncbi:MAG: J domain-containing protein [Byssovorax sp.]
MSLTTPFEEARAALGLGRAEHDPAVIKQAYRRAVAKHPPDQDPDAFRRVRDAYELLRDPWARAQDVLHRPLPQVPPPGPPPEPPAAPRGAAAVALLRLAVMRANPDTWAAAAPAKARRGRPKETT